MTDENIYPGDSLGAEMRPHKVAFLGGAFDSAVGRVHRIAVEMDQRFELVAGCFSREMDANQVSASKYGIAQDRIYGNLDDLLESEAGKIGAVVILTPTDQHEEQVVRCLSAGMPVICEKALVATSEEAIKVRDQLKASGGFLAVTYNYTGYPMLRELKRMVEGGHFGRIQQIHMEMPQEGFARLKDDGSPMVPQEWRLRDGRVPTISLDLGVHLHMMVRFLTRETPELVVATGDSFGNFKQIVDNVSCMARYTNGLSCNIWYSKTAVGYRNGLKIRVFGETGSAEWIQENPEYLQIADNAGGKHVLDRASKGITVSNQDRYTRFKAGHPAGFIEAFANYYCDVADALDRFQTAGGEQYGEYVFGVEDALEGLRLLEAMARSAQGGGWEKVQ